MPELDPLPPPPRRPVLTPRPGDFDDMTRRVTRRRHARYGAAGSAVAVAAAVVLIANGGAPGIDTITAEPATTSTATATPSAGPSASGTSTPTPSPVAEPTSAPASPSGVPSSPPGPTATAAPSPSAVPSGAQPPPPPPDAGTQHASISRDEVAYTPGTCSGAGDPGWCVRTPTSRTVQAGEPSDYLMYACRLPGSGEGTLSFYSPDELSFGMVDQQGVTHYQWGRPNYSRETHRATVGSGRCARWTFTYDTTDRTGAPLKPGDYSGTFAIDAWFSGPASGSSGYGIAVRVVE